MDRQVRRRHNQYILPGQSAVGFWEYLDRHPCKGECNVQDKLPHTLCPSYRCIEVRSPTSFRTPLLQMGFHSGSSFAWSPSPTPPKVVGWPSPGLRWFASNRSKLACLVVLLSSNGECFTFFVKCDLDLLTFF